MKNVYQLISLCLLMAIATAANGQVRQVTGSVTSELDGEPIPEVMVRVKGSLEAVVTDEAGQYSIGVPETSSLILTFSHDDFDDEEISLGGRTELDVVMTSNIRYNQYGMEVDRNTLVSEHRDGILVFESLDQDYMMWLDLRVQADGALFFGDTYNDIGNGVAMRRVRIAFKTYITENWEAEIDMDFADALADLKDAFIMYKTDFGLDFKLGNYKERFSMENNISSRWLTFMERPAITRMIAPSRHLGLQLHYYRPYMMAAGGVHFQDVGDYEAVQDRKDNNRDFGVNEGYSLTGKFTLIPYYHDINKGLHFGIAGSYRTPKTHQRLDNVRFDSRSNININRKKYLETDWIDQVDHYILSNFELAGYYRNFRLAGEYTQAKVHRFNDLPTEDFHGFYVMTSVLLFGGTHLYNTYQGEFTQPINGREWGDIELAARYDYANMNSTDHRVAGGAGEGLTIALNYYTRRNVKFQLNYGYLNFDRYANQRGRWYVGEDVDGNLTTDPFRVVAPEGEAGENFHWLGARFQVAF